MYVPEPEPEVVVIIPPKIKPPPPAKYEPLTASIDEISTLGLVTIKFNQAIDSSLLTEDINTYFKPIVQPGAYEKTSTFNISKFDFVWNVTEFIEAEYTVLMQINFTDAIYISEVTEFKDELIIEFPLYESIKSKGYDFPIEKKFRKISSPIKK